jgi:hypothetical protein
MRSNATVSTVTAIYEDFWVREGRTKSLCKMWEDADLTGSVGIQIMGFWDSIPSTGSPNAMWTEKTESQHWKKENGISNLEVCMQMEDE